MGIEIRCIDANSRRDVNAFIDLAFRLYKDCPQWVPPLIDDVKLMFNRRKYPYYEHSEADFFLAERDGKVVGRVAALNNRHYNEHWESKTCFFNLLDMEDDPAITRLLMQSVEAWAAQRGLTKVVGAKGFLQGDGIGVLVDGFEHRPAVGIPYNHSYYGPHLEQCGYTCQRDFLSTYLPGTVDAPERMKAIAGKMMEKRGFTIRRFRTKSELRAMIPAIVETYNRTFIRNWEFNPVTPAEAKVIGDRLLSIADPHYIKLVMKGDTIAGFILGYPDISDGICKAKGKIWPFGWYWIMRDFKKTRWIDLNGTGILPEYRGLGASAIMYSEMADTMHEGQFLHADCCQMEQSVLTLRDSAIAGGKVYKTHRIFEKALAA